MELSGVISYLVFFLTLTGIYALLALGLNVQWGYAGMLNIGIAAFFAIGAYTSALLTVPATAQPPGLGLPVPLGMLGAMLAASVLACLIGLLTLNLRSDYLAIATIGIAEIVRLFLKNEDWLTNGVRGIAGIPRPFAAESSAGVFYLLLVAALVALSFLVLQVLYRAPWGRVLRAIRDRETAAMAAGKNVLRFRLQAFVTGSAVMGLAGAAYTHFVGFISPEAFDPLFATFIVWVMLITGGSGNNAGAVLGALVIWGVWSLTEIISAHLFSEALTTQAGAIRVLLIGLLLQVILVLRPHGLLPEPVTKSPGNLLIK